MQQNSSWVPYFPHGVQLEKELLIDLALQQSYPLNAAAQEILDQVDGQKTLGELSSNYSLNCSFLVDLNDKGLINFKIPWREQLTLWPLQVVKSLGFYLPSLQNPNLRPDLLQNSLFKTFCFLLIKYLQSLFLDIGVIVVILGGFFLKIGFPLGILITVVVSLSVAGSVVLHEIGHIMMIPKTSMGERRFFILFSSFVPAVIMSQMEPWHKFLVALSGPLIDLLAALALLGASFLVRGWWHTFFVTEGILVSLASISILPFFEDGKIVWNYICSGGTNK